MTCYPVSIDGFLLDGLTADGGSGDGNGLVYSWTDLAGWFDSGDLSIQTEQRPFGVSEVAVNAGGRTITVSGIISDPQPSLPVGDRAPSAMQTLKRYCALTFATGLFVVTEPTIELQSRVRLATPIRMKPQPSTLGFANVGFQIPLLAPDPRRYSTTLTTDTSLTGPSNSTNDGTITNNGDLPAPFTATITSDDAVNPYIRSLDIPGLPFVRYIGSIGGGDTLIFDMDALTATLNGGDVTDQCNGPSSGPPAWWALPAGTSNVRLGSEGGGGTINASIAYRDAYS